MIPTQGPINERSFLQQNEAKLVYIMSSEKRSYFHGMDNVISKF